LYPALQLLEDQGLVRSESADGRRQFTLTDEGRAELKARPRPSAPWETMVHQADQGDMALRAALHHVAVAVHQVAEAGTDEQKARADALLKELRRQMYLLLAETLAPQGEAPAEGTPLA
jgi:DNA-binding PadR family transcriptional regulator